MIEDASLGSQPLKILNILVSINNGLIEALKESFSYIILVPRPEI